MPCDRAPPPTGIELGKLLLGERPFERLPDRLAEHTPRGTRLAIARRRQANDTAAGIVRTRAPLHQPTCFHAPELMRQAALFPAKPATELVRMQLRLRCVQQSDQVRLTRIGYQNPTFGRFSTGWLPSLIA